MSTPEPAPSRGRRILIWSAAGLGGLILLGLGAAQALSAASYFLGPIPIDEWECSQGEIIVQKVGRPAQTSCRRADYELADDEELALFPNRPYECDNRDGWIQLERGRGRAFDCWPEGEPLSAEVKQRGWHVDQHAYDDRGWLLFR